MYIGIDIGASNIRIASFKNTRAKKFSDLIKFKVTADFKQSIQRIINSIKEISDKQPINGIGLVMAGVIDTKNKIIIKSANLPDWEQKPIGDILENEFKTEVIMENDAVAPAICEYLFGHAKKYDKFLYLIWGTGVGGSYIEINNNNLSIHKMEPGHQIINNAGIKCGCGQCGCLEAYIGGGSLEKKHGKEFYKNLTEKQWQEIAVYAAQGIINTLLHFPVELIVFGGGVILNNPHLLNGIKDIMTRRELIYPVPLLKLLKNGDKSALYGAMGLFLINR